MKLQRWNDWLFIFAIVCYVVSPLGNAIILFGVERPEYSELAKTFDPSMSRPGHFISAGVTKIFRTVATALGLFLGVLFTLIGSFRVPRSATSTRRLRNTTWLVFCGTLFVCLAISIL